VNASYLDARNLDLQFVAMHDSLDQSVADPDHAV
jgi:hypothetical protein